MLASKLSRREDAAGYSVRVTRFPGGYGVRVLCHGRVVAQAPRLVPKRAIGATVRDELRMLDKCAAGSPMAEASRRRGRAG